MRGMETCTYYYLQFQDEIEEFNFELHGIDMRYSIKEAHYDDVYNNIMCKGATVLSWLRGCPQRRVTSVKLRELRTLGSVLSIRSLLVPRLVVLTRNV